MHVHGHSAATGWVVRIALLATLGLIAVEFTVGALGHSLAVVSDGWHNVSDLPTLMLAWVALYFQGRPPDRQKTFGYHRAGVLAAFVNALILVGVALFICWEGYQRILNPQPVAARSMVLVGVLALAVNGGISLGLSRERHDLSLRTVFVHNFGDALSNIGIILGGWVISRTGAHFIDPLLAFLIAGLVLWSSVRILVDSANILLEGLPKGMDLGRVALAMLAVPEVREVHDVHIWSLDTRSHALSCHVRILDMTTSESERIAQRIRQLLAAEFGITHCTIQFEHTHAPGDFHKYMPEPAPARKE
jgi:cobalt-zinc-cadmium efflux system protein